MGLSTSVGLLFLGLMIIIGITTVLSVVHQSILLNSPSRVSAMSNHIRENLYVEKNLNNNTISIESRWSQDSYIIAVLILDSQTGNVIKIVTFTSNIKIVKPFETIYIDVNDLNISSDEFDNYDYIVITRYGNSYPAIEQLY